MIFWKHKKNCSLSPLAGKIEIFLRQCLRSEISKNKKRPEGFSYERCFQNLYQSIDRKEANLTILLDQGEHLFEKTHFLHQSADPIISIQKGKEAESFLVLLDYLKSLQLHPDTLIYLVEDDYWHRPGWISVLKEAFSLPVDYATLYDHSDKYDKNIYPSLRSQVFVTKSCHWRTTPSTTHTFAARYSTLMEDLSIHRKYSFNRIISEDHKKFLALGRKGRVLVSSIPGYSTHLDPQHLSPCVNWNL